MSTGKQQRTEQDQVVLHETIDLIDSECKRLGITRNRFMQSAGLEAGLVTTWLTRESNGQITKLTPSTIAKIHAVINGNKPKAPTTTRTGPHPGNNASIEETTKNLNYIKRAAKELGMTIHELEKAAGLRGGVVYQWEFQLKRNHPTWFRGQTLPKLKAKIKELREKQRQENQLQDQQAIEAMKKERVVEVANVTDRPLLMDNGGSMLPRPAPVLQVLTEADFDDHVHQPLVVASNHKPTACQALIQHIRERMEGMTLVQLAQLIAHIDGMK